MANDQKSKQNATSWKRTDDRGQPGRNSRPPRARDVNRVRDYKVDAAFRGDSWAQAVEEDERGEQYLATARRPTRRAGKQPNRTPLPKQSTTETPPMDEPLYEGVGLGSAPDRLQASHNLDFAGFIPLVEESYDTYCEADPTFGRTIPFAMWQHANVELLQATILSNLKKNSDPYTYPHHVSVIYYV